MKLNRSMFRYTSILLLLFFLFPDYSFAQSDSSHFKKWSFGINGGILLPCYDMAGGFVPSPLLGVKAEYNFNPYISIYLQTNYNFLKLYHRPFEDDAFPQITTRSIETSFGVKCHVIDSVPGFYIQSGIGNYYFEKDYWDYITTSDNFSFNLGMGYEFPVVNNFKIEFGFNSHFIISKQLSASNYILFYTGISFKL